MTVDIYRAQQADLGELARLVWLNAGPDQQATQSVAAFEAELSTWWTDHDSHVAFVARLDELVGMAWLALAPRVPRPGQLTRWSGDIQSVFVLPEHRGSGIGTALVQAAIDHAGALGVGRITVKSGRKAVPVYERLGFTSIPQLLEVEIQGGSYRRT
jgi:GNAT superfamily N-acetyltransferase